MNWSTFIQEQQGYLQSTLDRVAKERAQGIDVYPQEDLVFAALETTPFDRVKVVILGQDPYHGPGQAHGLSFSVLPGVKIPPSLRNMYKELEQDIDGFISPKHGFLQSWAEQGVLLLNAVLTVRDGEPNSHKKLGWERFTDKAIQALSQSREGLIFLFWGAHAQKKAALIDESRHHILSAPHPSPLSARRGFFGCRHFSRANELLTQQKRSPIDWCLASLD
mgnify:CR=1 FL=1